MNADKLQSPGLILFSVLFFWYSLIFFNIPGLLIAGPVELLSLSSLLELFLILLLTGYLVNWKYTDYFTLIILGLWGYLQYAAHWQYLLFKPSQAILDRYYHYFQGTLRFIAPSSTRIIPDAYHTVLGVLIYSNLVMVLFKIILLLSRSIKEKRTALTK